MEKTEPVRTKVKSLWNKCRGIKEVEVEEVICEDQENCEEIHPEEENKIEESEEEEIDEETEEESEEEQEKELPTVQK